MTPFAERCRPQPDVGWALPTPPSAADLGYPLYPGAPVAMCAWPPIEQCRAVYLWWNQVRSYWQRAPAHPYRGHSDRTKWAPAVLLGVKELEARGVCVVDWIRHVSALPSADRRPFSALFQPKLIETLADWCRRQYPAPGGGPRRVTGPCFYRYMEQWHQAVATARCAHPDPYRAGEAARLALDRLDLSGVELEAASHRARVRDHLVTYAWIWPFTAAGV